MGLSCTRMVREPRCTFDTVCVLNHEDDTLAAGERLLVGSESKSAIDTVRELGCLYQ
jgi:hypothetical protein